MPLYLLRRVGFEKLTGLHLKYSQRVICRGGWGGWTHPNDPYDPPWLTLQKSQGGSGGGARRGFDPPTSPEKGFRKRKKIIVRQKKRRSTVLSRGGDPSSPKKPGRVNFQRKFFSICTSPPVVSSTEAGKLPPGHES